jgi:hypothetical protein
MVMQQFIINVDVMINTRQAMHEKTDIEASSCNHEQQHDCHHDTKVKPEAATTVIELLMMSGKTPETC